MSQATPGGPRDLADPGVWSSKAASFWSISWLNFQRKWSYPGPGRSPGLGTPWLGSGPRDLADPGVWSSKAAQFWRISRSNFHRRWSYLGPGRSPGLGTPRSGGALGTSQILECGAPRQLSSRVPEVAKFRSISQSNFHKKWSYLSPRRSPEQTDLTKTDVAQCELALSLQALTMTSLASLRPWDQQHSAWHQLLNEQLEIKEWLWIQIRGSVLNWKPSLHSRSCELSRI